MCPVHPSSVIISCSVSCILRGKQASKLKTLPSTLASVSTWPELGYSYMLKKEKQARHGDLGGDVLILGACWPAT